MKRVWFWSLLLMTMLVIGEGALRLAELAFPTVRAVLSPEGRVQPDAALGYRLTPGFPGHDALGYRNEAVPDSAAVVVLGDSQTYGTGVAAAEAWPQRLADELGVTVYNMGVGGYGAMHHLQRLDEALAFSPEVVVLALYTGNDLFDAFDAVHVRGLMAPLGVQPAGLQDSLASMEGATPLAAQAEAFAIPVLASMPELPDAVAWLRLARLGARGVWAVRRLRSQSSNTDGQWARLEALTEADTTLLAVESEVARTVLTPHRRYVALDRDDARIREGQRLTIEAIRQFIERCLNAGVVPVVVSIPTKEWAYHPPASPAPVLTRLHGHETNVLAAWKHHAEEAGGTVIPVGDALREGLERSIAIYPMHADGHPAPAGHTAIAERVAQELRPHVSASPG